MLRHKFTQAILALKFTDFGVSSIFDEVYLILENIIPNTD